MDKHATDWRWHAARAKREPRDIELFRRGVRHGFVVPKAAPLASPKDPEGRFQRGEPILLRGWIALGDRRSKARIEASRRWFERLRRGESFALELRSRLARLREERCPVAAIRGTSEDLADPLEIEKLHVDSLRHGRAGRDMYAKLSWIADEECDDSLRVRFSFGSERSGDWKRDTQRALAADRLAEWAFPEGTLISRQRALSVLLERLCSARTRLSERIVYNNAPGGGASFHHDAEARQLGVVYGQLCGSTGWLALPRQELAEEIAQLAGASRSISPRLGSTRKVQLALEDTRFPPLERLLNRDPRLTRRLVERGAFYRLRAGDVLILPSPSYEVCAWHSVFALGRRPSIAHSYGLFAAASSRSR